MNKITTRTLPAFVEGRAIGFDKILDMIEDTWRPGSSSAYPPYNVVQVDDNNFVIEVAIAGFDTGAVDVTHDKNKLVISTTNNPKPKAAEVTYLHKGISTRSFKHEFSLADYVTVTSAKCKNGILSVELLREVPDEVKPKKINIVDDNI